MVSIAGVVLRFLILLVIAAASVQWLFAQIGSPPALRSDFRLWHAALIAAAVSAVRSTAPDTLFYLLPYSIIRFLCAFSILSIHFYSNRFQRRCKDGFLRHDIQAVAACGMPLCLFFGIWITIIAYFNANFNPAMRLDGGFRQSMVRMQTIGWAGNLDK